MSQDKIIAPLAPDASAMKAHLEFLFSGCEDYRDGLVELGATAAADKAIYKVRRYGLHELNTLVEDALHINGKEGCNVYIRPALLDPDISDSVNVTDGDVYAVSCGWVDIDNDEAAPLTADDIKGMYKDGLEPSVVITTGTVPTLRTHLLFKYPEPQTDHDTIREVNTGLVQHFHGDVHCVNPSRYMRLGGSVAWVKKDPEKRINECVSVCAIPTARAALPEALISTYRAPDFVPAAGGYSTPERPYEYASKGGLNIGEEQIIDGRDAYMSDMVYASILKLTASLKRWPAPDEIMADCWPVYSRKVSSRNGRTLDQDKRGERAMRQKIQSKLRAFAGGKIRGFGTVDEVMERVQIDPITGEVGSSGNVSRKKISWIEADSISPVLEVKDFVEDTLRDHEMSVIYSRPNSGKTFMAIDLALHVALGLLWNGKRVEQGTVVYLALEGGHGVKNRIAAFKQHHKITQPIPMAVIPQAVNLVTKDGLKDLLPALADIQAQHGQIRLIIIDTLARAMAGTDENSTKDMGILVAACDEIREATGAHLTLIHHTGKDEAKGARGSSALLGGIDTEIELKRPKDSSVVTVSITKQREMEMGKDTFFGLQTVSLGTDRRGKEVSSCIVVPADAEEVATVSGKLKSGTKSRVAYDILVECIADHGFHSFSGMHPRNVRGVTEETFKKACLDRGLLTGTPKQHNTQFGRIRKTLIENGLAVLKGDFIWIPH